MELSEIVSISGMGGLHKIVGQRSNGMILETLDATKKRFPTSLNTKVSVLEDIAIYTTTTEVPLRKVLKAIFQKEKDGLTIPDKKAENAELTNFLAAVLPDFDRERVYPSDIRKLASWYLILKENIDLENLQEELTADTEASAEGKVEEEEGEKEAKPKKAKSAKADVNKTAVAKNIGPKASSRTAGGAARKTGTPRKTGGS